MPYVPITIAWGISVQRPVVVLDTGFTGDLLVTPQIAKDLGLEVKGVTHMQVANGDKVPLKMALALATMEGATNLVQVLISPGLSLIGISFLTKFGYKAIIDCKYRTVVLEK